MSKRIGLSIVFLFFAGGGIAHFAVTDLFVGIMPPYIPAALHRAAVHVSGAFEILGAFALLIPSLRQWAGNGLIALTVAVTPANVHMWLHPDMFPDFPPLFLSLRLVTQVLLIACIWWATRGTNSQPGAVRFER